MIRTVFGLCVLLQVKASGNIPLKYKSVIANVMYASNPDIIPILANEQGPLTVTLTFSLVDILDVDVEKNQVDVLILLVSSWQNKALAWNVNDVGFNVTSINIETYYLWLPDITIVNAVTKPEITTPELAVVHNDGSVYWSQIISARVPCDLHGVNSEQGANCTTKLFSWTYNSALLTLTDESSSNLDEYNVNPSYELLGTSHNKESKYYTCCPEPYEFFHFNFAIRSTKKQAEVY